MTRTFTMLIVLAMLSGCCGGKDKVEERTAIAEAEVAAAKAAAEEASAASATAQLTKTFTSHEQLGYTVKHPDHWTVNADNPLMVIMGGEDGSKPDVGVTISIQGVQKEGDAPMDEKVIHEVENMKKQIMELDGGKVEELDPYGYKDAEGNVRKSRTFLLTFKHGGVLINKWVVMIPGAVENIMWSFSYQHTEEGFEKHKPLATSVLESLALTM